MSDYQPIDRCIACGGKRLQFVFDLGWQPLANSYKRLASDPDPRFPLAINSCIDCRHVQLTHQVEPTLLFKNYSYMSGVSRTTLDFFQWFAEQSLLYFDLLPVSVLDIGCNDGSQLDIYKSMGLVTHGVDPAETLYQQTSQRHHVICDFFSDGQFEKTFDIITVQNAFAHNSNQLALLQNIKKLMTSKSNLFVVTSHCHMLSNGEFDTVYHEHLSFYNIQSMRALCRRAELHLVDVKTHPIHGGSYIFVIQTEDPASDHIQQLIDREHQNGLYDTACLENFRNKTVENVSQMKMFLEDCDARHIPVFGYGAPAKSSVFFNYSGLSVQKIIEDTSLKQGKYTPGSNIPIVSPAFFEEIQALDQVCWLILAWNFYDEIKGKIVAQRSNHNDLFVKYLPKFSVEANLK